MEELINQRLVRAGYKPDSSGIFRSGNEGYWSNLNRDENKRLMQLLEVMDPREAVRQAHPGFEDIIFSPKRDVALELMDIKPDDVCADYGCMWGALAIGLSKRGKHTVAFDQTGDSLTFLNYRKRHERIDNLTLVQDDIRNIDLEGMFDCSLVNGVLEWVPEVGEIELKKFYGKKSKREKPLASPRDMQLNFLKKVHRNLRTGGRLLLAIENRFDYMQFLGRKDPHADLYLTAMLPRALADLVSRVMLGRPYVNYIYSFRGLEKLLHEAGFKGVDLFTVFPNYHFPELLLPYQGGLKFYQRYKQPGGLKTEIGVLIEKTLMKSLKAKMFAPSIVAVARK